MRDTAVATNRGLDKANEWLQRLQAQDIMTVGDLRDLTEEDWPSLGLTVFASRVLKNALTGKLARTLSPRNLSRSWSGGAQTLQQAGFGPGPGPGPGTINLTGSSSNMVLSSSPTSITSTTAPLTSTATTSTNPTTSDSPSNTSTPTPPSNLTGTASPPHHHHTHSQSSSVSSTSEGLNL